MKKDEEIWFFDESRFGTHSKIGHGWFEKGKRTEVKFELGYKNFYVYSAANPRTGEAFSLILPKVNLECMNVFMREFSKKYAGRKIAMIMDGAGWHKSKKMKKIKGIRKIIQPPYSPELNPIEKLWQYIKDKTIRNKIFKEIKKLEDEICDFIKNIKNETIKTVCNVNYI